MSVWTYRISHLPEPQERFSKGHEGILCGVDLYNLMVENYVQLEYSFYQLIIQANHLSFTKDGQNKLGGFYLTDMKYTLLRVCLLIVTHCKLCYN